jgi:hypothetical protein
LKFVMDRRNHRIHKNIALGASGEEKVNENPFACAADTATSSAPLPAGKPAGVQQAQLGGNTLLYIGVLAAVGVFIGVTATAGKKTGFTTGATISQH